MSVTTAAAGRVDSIVRGGTVVTPDWTGPADVLVGSGRVMGLVEPGAFIGNGVDEVDASGALVMPGGVDPHCHVGFTSGEFTSLDDYRQATTAAVFGGTTTIVDFAIPRPGQRPADAVEIQRAKAVEGLCDSALHGCVVEWDSTVPAQLDAMVADGIVTVKMFTTYAGETMATEDTMLRVMAHLRDLGGMVYAHCEADHIIEDTQNRCAHGAGISAAHHHETRPPLAEAASVTEVLSIAESVGAPVYLVHQSTPEAVDLAARARRRGQPVFTEAVAHHLVLDETRYLGEHPERFVCCPPLRPATEVRALVDRALTGQISTVGSDHCCYDTAQKLSRRDDVRLMPNGLPGVETRLPVVYDQLVSRHGLPVSDFVRLTATMPAILNGLYPRKGTLLPGADADIVIWEPARPWTISSNRLHMATDYTPYENSQVVGSPRTVMVGGRVVVHEGQLVDGEAHGRHLRARPLALAGTRRG